MAAQVLQSDSSSESLTITSRTMLDNTSKIGHFCFVQLSWDCVL